MMRTLGLLLSFLTRNRQRERLVGDDEGAHTRPLSPVLRSRTTLPIPSIIGFRLAPLWFLGFLMPPCRSCGLSDSGPSMSKIEDEDAVEIRDVWADNLEAEFAVIRDVVDDFAFVAMDTEFPGVAVRPLGEFKTVADHNYRILRANVDLLHLIKLGLTFSDADGNLPTSSTAGARPIVRQFNFTEFDVGRDVSNPTPSTSSGNRALICRGIGRTGSTPSGSRNSSRRPVLSSMILSAG
ncbi:unnamed protein product [Musa textilis]